MLENEEKLSIIFEQTSLAVCTSLQACKPLQNYTHHTAPALSVAVGLEHQGACWEAQSPAK